MKIGANADELADRYNPLKEEKVSIQQSKSYRGLLVNIPNKYLDVLKLEPGTKLTIYPEIIKGYFTGRIILRPENLRMDPVPFAMRDYLQNMIEKRIEKQKKRKQYSEKELVKAHSKFWGIKTKTFRKGMKKMEPGDASTNYLRNRTIAIGRMAQTFDKAVFHQGSATWLGEGRVDPKALEKELEQDLAQFKVKGEKILQEVMEKPEGGRKVDVKSEIEALTIPTEPLSQEDTLGLVIPEPNKGRSEQKLASINELFAMELAPLPMKEINERLKDAPDDIREHVKKMILKYKQQKGKGGKQGK